MSIHRFEDYGIAVIGNSASKYGFLLPISLERGGGNVKYIVKDFKNLASFILKITDKHLLAGLPISSIIGTTLRRLTILLNANPNTQNLVLILNNSERHYEKLIVNSAEDVISIIQKYFYMLSNKNNSYNNISIEKIIKRGRFEAYGINKSRFLETLTSIKEITITGIEKLPKLRGEILKSFDDLVKILPQQESFSICPTRIFKPSYTLDSYNLRSESIKTLYNNIGKYLYTFGIKCKDKDGLERIQLQEKIRCVLEYKDDEESKSKEVREYLNELGIEDDITLKKTIFFKRIKGYIDEYVCNIVDSLINKKLGYTNVLSFFDEQQPGPESVQLGWIYTHMYSIERERNDKNSVILLNCLHDLRSVDFHDGLPYNLLFCVELSELMRDKIVELKEKSNEDLNIKLHRIELHIVSLHAYVDNFPAKR